jgi:predicted dehydrogenase
VNTLKVGIIGAGGIAQGSHLPGYQAVPGVEVEAVCDVREETARAAARKFSIPHVYTDWKVMLRERRLDVVSVCTPNNFHAAPTIAALEAGAHVLCEKPIAASSKEAEAMCAAARKAKRRLMVGLNNRFTPSAQKLKEFIRAGELGKIYYVRVQALRRRGVPGWGVFIRKDMSGGGPLYDIGVHLLDLALWLMGHPKPVAVSGGTYCAHGRRSGLFMPWGAWDPKQYTVEDMGAGFVRFQNGCTLTIEASWSAHIPEDVWNVTLLGVEGGATTNPFRIFQEKRATLLDVTPVRLPEGEPSHTAEIRAFIEAIRTGKPTPVPGEEAAVATRILEAVYTSSKTGREVRL